MPSPQDVSARRRSFRQLHASGCFVIPNPWDPGSANYLEKLGFRHWPAPVRALPGGTARPLGKASALRLCG